jgi:putative ABC transport system ATP-binding protein
MTSFLSAKAVTKAYGQGAAKTVAVRGVSLELEAGSFCALVGPSGCGKTTLLSLIGAMDRPDSGDLIVGGTNLARADLATLTSYRRSVLGFVFQFYNLLPSLTAQENVEASLEFLPLSVAQRRARAREFLARVGLSGCEEKFPSQISGGQQQRVAIARALARRPALLLADEPTGNLDQETGARVLDLLFELQRELKTTCIVATHDPALARRADQVVSMLDGSVTSQRDRGAAIVAAAAVQ